MNKDHEEDTKAIVHHVTSIPVSNYTIQFIILIYEIQLSLAMFVFGARSYHTDICSHAWLLKLKFQVDSALMLDLDSLGFNVKVCVFLIIFLSHLLSVSSWNKSYLPRSRLLFKGTLSSSEFLSQDAHKTESKTLSVTLLFLNSLICWLSLVLRVLQNWLNLGLVVVPGMWRHW